MSDPNDNDTCNGADEQGILPFDDGSMERVIRRVWHDGRWLFSVIDVIAVLTDSDKRCRRQTRLRTIAHYHRE